MKALKRIAAVLALMLTLAGAVWGEVSKEDVLQLNQRYEWARGFFLTKVHPRDARKSSLDTKNLKEDFEEMYKEFYGTLEPTVAPYFHSEKNSLELPNNLTTFEKAKGEVIVGVYKTDHSYEIDFKEEINYSKLPNKTHLIWCFLAEDLKENWNNIFIEGKDRRICIIEYLGLNPNHYQNEETNELFKGKIVFFKVNISDLMRPCYEPDITKLVNQKQVAIIGNERNAPLMNKINQWAIDGNETDETKNSKRSFELRKRKTVMMLGDYVRQINPLSLCTRLGYTLNYSGITYSGKKEKIEHFNKVKEIVDVGDLTNYKGMTEFIILDHSKISKEKEYWIDNLKFEDLDSIISMGSGYELVKKK